MEIFLLGERQQTVDRTPAAGGSGGRRHTKADSKKHDRKKRYGAR
ncbi:MAG: hypothetical protein ACQERN_09990 [Thermodesulfobacteriota bacterium]